MVYKRLGSVSEHLSCAIFLSKQQAIQNIYMCSKGHICCEHDQRLMSSSVRVGMAPWVKIIRMLAGALGGVGAKMLRALCERALDGQWRKLAMIRTLARGRLCGRHRSR